MDDTGPAVSQMVETFTIITTEPNPMIAAVHNRMPVILGPEHYRWWLEPERFELQFLKTLLRPYPAEDMACVRVSKLVNNARHDSPACFQPGEDSIPTPAKTGHLVLQPRHKDFTPWTQPCRARNV